MSDPHASVLPIGTTKGNEMTLTNYINTLSARTDLTADEAVALVLAAVNDKAYI